jgi:hypothetical protein
MEYKPTGATTVAGGLTVGFTESQVSKWFMHTGDPEYAGLQTPLSARKGLKRLQ